MSQEITGDPVTTLPAWAEGRYIFTSQEDNIATLLNDNIRKTVDLQEEFESEISTLQSEMDTAQSEIDSNDTDISDLQSSVGNRLKIAKYDRLVGALQVCETDGAASSGDTSLSVTATKMALLQGDNLVAFDPATGTGQTITVSADVTEGSTSLPVQALSAGLPDGRAILLDRSSTRGGGVAEVNAYLQSEESTDLKTLAQDVSNLQSTTSDLSSDISDLGTEIGQLSAKTNTIQGELASVSSSVQTLEDEVRLGVTSRVANDQELAKVNSTNLDGSSTDQLPVDNIAARIEKDDYILAYNDADGKKFLVQVGSIGSGNDVWEPSNDGTSTTITLQQTHPLDLPDDSSIYLAPISYRSELSVVKDEVALRVKKGDMLSELQVQLDNITTETDIFKSSNFDGDVDRSSDLAQPGSSLGTAGWALYEDGTIIGNSARVRGLIEATSGVFEGGIEMKPGSTITNADGTYSLSVSGFDVFASEGVSGSERAFGIWGKSSGAFLGGLTANVSGSTPKVVLDASSGNAATALLAKATRRAQLRSMEGNVFLSAEQGSVQINSPDVIPNDIWRASGVSDLETKYGNANGGADPPQNMLWVNESQGNRIEAYTAANITATVDAGFSVNEEFNNEQYVFVSDTSDVDGTTVTEYKYEWGDGSSPTTNGIGSAGHQYNDGTYTITLTVSTEAGVSDTATQTVDIPTETYEPPPSGPGPIDLPVK